MRKDQKDYTIRRLFSKRGDFFVMTINQIMLCQQLTLSFTLLKAIERKKKKLSSENQAEQQIKKTKGEKKSL